MQHLPKTTAIQNIFHWKLVLPYINFKRYFHCFKLLPTLRNFKISKAVYLFYCKLHYLHKSSARLPNCVKYLSLLELISSHKNEITKSRTRTTCGERSFLNHLVKVIPVYIYGFCAYIQHTDLRKRE